MSIFQKVTLKTLKENRTRTIVTIIGIILSLSMFTAVTVSISSFRNYLVEITKLREGNWHGCVSVTDSELNMFASDEQIEAVSFLECIGYAKVDGCMNQEKPYLYIGGMDESANGTLPIIITEGRMPETSDELLLPAHLSYNGGVTYSLNDVLTLEIGDRISSGSAESSTLGQNNPYLYTVEELQAQGLSQDTIASQETEQLIPRLSHTYTVVGFYERPSIEPYSAPGYTALTISEGSLTSDAYTAYIRFENPQDAMPWLESHFQEGYDVNSDLLRMYAASYESSYNRVLFGLGSVLIFIILFGSISLIYNAFSISVTERTKQFGLLASVGATKKQLVHSVLFEAFSLCVIGIPLGILAGIAGIGITFAILGDSISNILWEDFAMPLSIHVSPVAVIFAALLGLFTVLISAYLPARRSARLSPIESIRLTADINIRPGKVKTSMLTYKLFGLSGMLASKNFKRNRKKYRATVFSLFVSVVLFISASSFCSYLMKSAENILSDTGCDIVYYRYGNETDAQASISNDDVLARLSALDSVDSIAWIQYDTSSIYVDTDALSSEYLAFIGDMYSEEIPQNDQGQSLVYAQLYFVDDSAYQAYVTECGLPTEFLTNQETPTAIAFDFFRYYQGNSGQYQTFHALNGDSATMMLPQIHAPEGYIFSGYYTDEHYHPIYCFYNASDPKEVGLELAADSCSTMTSMTIGAVADTPPFFLGDSYYSGLLLLYPASAMETVLGSDMAEYVAGNSSTFLFTASDHAKATEDISATLKDMGLNYDSIYDYAESVAQERSMLMIITVFSYGFIILISLIALANVFNTISTNIQLRKREFAMLKSTGMTPRGFTVMMCYECLLYGIKGLL